MKQHSISNPEWIETNLKTLGKNQDLQHALENYLSFKKVTGAFAEVLGILISEEREIKHTLYLLGFRN